MHRLSTAGRRRLGPLALAVALAVPAVARAEGACDPSAVPQVTLTPLFAVPTIDTARDLAALQQSARDSGSLHPGLGMVLGLTTAQVIHGFEHTVAYEAVPAGVAGRSFCGVARSVELRLGFAEVAIHIAREVVRDDCLYAQVYQHESRHVQVDREMLATEGPRLLAAMRTAVAAIGVVRAESPDAVAAVIRRRIETALDGAFDAFARTLRGRQTVVDRPEEYRRLSLACNRAAARIIAASRRPPG